MDKVITLGYAFGHVLTWIITEFLIRVIELIQH